MSGVDRALGLIKDALTFRDNIAAMRASIAGLGSDVAALAADHAALTSRVSRIEGFIEGAAAAAPRRTRLPKG